MISRTYLVKNEQATKKTRYRTMFRVQGREN